MNGVCPTCKTKLSGKDKHAHASSHDYRRIAGNPDYQLLGLTSVEDNRTVLTFEERAQLQNGDNNA